MRLFLNETKLRGTPVRLKKRDEHGLLAHALILELIMYTNETVSRIRIYRGELTLAN